MLIYVGKLWNSNRPISRISLASFKKKTIEKNTTKLEDNVNLRGIELWPNLSSLYVLQHILQLLHELVCTKCTSRFLRRNISGASRLGN